MEIIKNNFKKDENELIQVQCSNCNSVLRCTKEEMNHTCPCCGHPLKTNTFTCGECGEPFEYKLEDCTIEEYGLYFTDCPHCNSHISIDESIDVTSKNLKEEYFSNNTYHPVLIPFTEIKEWIARGIRFLKENPDSGCFYTACGDSFVLVTRDENEFYVMLTRDYKDTYLQE